MDSAETDVLIISFVTASSNPSALHVLDGLKLNQSLETASAAGVTIMFAPISFAEGYREITSEPYGILKVSSMEKPLYVGRGDVAPTG